MDIADLAVGLGIVASKTLYFGLREKKKKPDTDVDWFYMAFFSIWKLLGCNSHPAGNFPKTEIVSS